MKLGVFMPGRLASERLPNKLILPIGDTCLWEIACKKLSLLPDKYNKYVLVSDFPLIEIAKKFENIRIIIRDPKTTKVDGPLTYIFKDVKFVEDTHLMFLNPCLLNFSNDTLLKALIEFEREGMDYATSVKKFQNWLFDSDGDNVNEMDYKTLSTKTIKPWYQAAHCFHIFNKDAFFKDGMMLKETLGFIEVPDEETIDVDTEMDYKYARWYYETRY